MNKRFYCFSCVYFPPFSSIFNIKIKKRGKCFFFCGKRKFELNCYYIKLFELLWNSKIRFLGKIIEENFLFFQRLNLKRRHLRKEKKNNWLRSLSINHRFFSKTLLQSSLHFPSFSILNYILPNNQPQITKIIKKKKKNFLMI